MLILSNKDMNKILYKNKCNKANVLEDVGGIILALVCGPIIISMSSWHQAL